MWNITLILKLISFSIWQLRSITKQSLMLWNWKDRQKEINGLVIAHLILILRSLLQYTYDSQQLFFSYFLNQVIDWILIFFNKQALWSFCDLLYSRIIYYNQFQFILMKAIFDNFFNTVLNTFILKKLGYLTRFSIFFYPFYFLNNLLIHIIL